MDRESEQSVVSRAMEGDMGAFEEIVRLFAPRLMRFLSLSIKDAGLVEEVVQETLLRAHQGLPGLRQATRFKPWLWRIGRHVARDSLRRERSQRAGHSVSTGLDESDMGPGELLTPEHWLEYNSLMEKVLVEVKALSETSASLIKMRYLDGLSYQEMADVLGLSQNQVKSRLARARQRLKISLEDLAPDWRQLLNAMS